MTEQHIEHLPRNADVANKTAQFDLRDLMQPTVSTGLIDRSAAQYLPGLELTGHDGKLANRVADTGPQESTLSNRVAQIGPQETRPQTGPQGTEQQTERRNTTPQQAEDRVLFTGALDDETLRNQKLDPTGIALTEKIALSSQTTDEDRYRSLQVLLKNDIKQFIKDGEVFEIKLLSSDTLTLSKNNKGTLEEVWTGSLSQLRRTNETVKPFLPTPQNSLPRRYPEALPHRRNENQTEPKNEKNPEQKNEKQREKNDKQSETPKSKEEKLFDPHVSHAEKIKLAQELYKEGKSTLKGPDGKTYQINVQRVGDRELVGIFGQDAQHRTQPLMRGIVESDGTVSKQRDSKGHEVDYQTEWAKKNMPESGLIKFEPRQEKPELPKPSEKTDLEQSRQRLKESAEKIADPKARAQFLQDMETFENRAKKQGLSPDEIAKTMDQTRRLLDAKEGATTSEQRVLAARGLAHHLAAPSDTDQGQHSTCGPTSLGERTLTRNPARAAEIIATTAIEGKWTAPDGKVIKIPAGNLTPGIEEQTFPPLDGDRSFAMQLMNAALINDMTQRRMPPELYVQGRVEFEGDTGERLYYEGQDPKDGRPYNGHTGPELAEEGKRLNGDRNFILQDPEISSGDDVVAIRSEQDLKNAIETAQRTGNMPLVVFLDSNDPIFGRSGKGPHAFHFVSITGYDPATGKVKMSNQWGQAKDKEVPIADLWRAMKFRKS
jgi:hypothetical protein